MSRWWSVIGIVVALALFGVAAAVATLIDEDGGLFVVDEEQEDEGEPGLPPFLTGEKYDLPPGLADTDELPPGLAKKLDDNTPPGLDRAEVDLPPGLARKGKIPPGHARKLGVDPQPGDEGDD